ncbi:alpha/beta hydrolase family protein [Pseudoneobacillus sp. C159]
MKKNWFYFIMMLLLLSACTKEVKTQEKGIIVSQVQVVNDAFIGVEVFELSYLSDGLKVDGYIIKPAEIPEGKAPVFIFNRGGNRDYGAIYEDKLEALMTWAQKGYVVLASQYRGSVFSEGKDEFGGGDVNDVLNLEKVAEELPYADSNNMVMLGASRGGMMTYLAVKHGMNLKAAAVVGGVSDLFKVYYDRADMQSQVLEPLVGNPIKDSGEYMKRSAVYWADELNVPLLILHGDADSHVSVKQAENLAAKLKEYNKEYKFISYPGGNHGLGTHREQILKEIDQWFESYLE